VEIAVALMLLVVVVGAIAYSLLDKPNAIDYYRLADDSTLCLGSTSGPGANVRVTSVVETSQSVTIIVKGFDVALGPSTGVGYLYESVAQLRDPLNGREVIDGSDGQSVAWWNGPRPVGVVAPCP